MAEKSYTLAISDTPLLGDTIGENLDRTVARYPDRLALVDVPAGIRLSYVELNAEVDALALGLLDAGISKGDRVGIWAPNCAEWTLTQYATAKIGAILVNINPAYRTSELDFVLNQSGRPLLVAAQKLKTSDYAAMIAEVRPTAPTWSSWSCSGRPMAGPPRHRQGRRPDRTGRDRALGRRGDQHPVHLGNHRLPEGRDPVPPQHPQQRLLRRRTVPVHGRGQDLHPRPLLPLLRHGDGESRGDHPRRRDDHPRAELRPVRPWKRSSKSAARRSTASRRCSSPSSRSMTSSGST